jgi:TetR/AcrR family transcriptional repressor of nem operon
MTKTNARDRLLDAAQTLMLSKGFHASRVDEICEGAGVSKGSFYHFFKTKEELGVEVLERYYRQTVKRLVSGDYQQLEDPIDRAFGFLDFVEEVAPELWSDGCLLGGFAIDLADTHPAIQTRVSELFSRMNQGLAVLFEPFSDRSTGEEHRPSAGEIAEHFLMVIEGSVVLAKAHGEENSVARGIDRFRAYLRGLSE